MFPGSDGITRFSAPAIFAKRIMAAVHYENASKLVKTPLQTPPYPQHIGSQNISDSSYCKLFSFDRLQDWLCKLCYF